MIRVALFGKDVFPLETEINKSGSHKVACKVETFAQLENNASYVDLVVGLSSSEEVCDLHMACGKLKLPLQLVPNGHSIKREVGDDELIQKLLETTELFPKRPHSTPGDGDYLAGKRVLITGAGGSIGGDLAIKVASFNPAHLTLLDNSENGVYEIDLDLSIKGFTHKTSIVTDIRDEARLERIVSEAKPQIVFHVAARKHVPLMERFPEEAVTTNIGGTIMMLRLAKKYGLEMFTFISTDKAADPANVMGVTKRVAERVIQREAREVSERFCIVRFENVLDSQGNVIYTFKRQLQMGGSLTVTSPEMNRYFITRNEASSFIVRATKLCDRAEVFVPDAGKPVFIDALARNIAKILGYREGIDFNIVYTKPRPGEKLTEELLTGSEQKRAKHLEGMFMCPPVNDDPPDFSANLAHVLAAAKNVDRKEIIRLLKLLEPTYRP